MAPEVTEGALLAPRVLPHRPLPRLPRDLTRMRCALHRLALEHGV